LKNRWAPGGAKRVKRVALLGILVVATLPVAWVSLRSGAKKPAGEPNTIAGPYGDYRVAADFEPKSGVWLASPPFDFKRGWSLLAVQANMIKALLGQGQVYYAVNSDRDVAALRKALLDAGVTERAIDAGVEFRRVAHSELWMRDTGGIYAQNGKGQSAVVGLDFDFYRLFQYLPAEDQVPLNDADFAYRIAAQAELPVVASPLVAEGGNFAFNGKGTVITLAGPLRSSNPAMSDEAIVKEIKRVFNVAKVILLPRNLPLDAHPVRQSPIRADGKYIFNFGVNHIDEMVAWLDERTVLLPQVDPEAVAGGNVIAVRTSEVLEEAFGILSAATDQAGRPLKIVRTVEPGAILVHLSEGDFMYDLLKHLNGIKHFPDNGPLHFAMAASYLNYVVANDVVLVPKFFAAGRDEALKEKDEAFRKLMQSHYPARKVVQIDVSALTVGGGGMHCATQQVPQ